MVNKKFHVTLIDKQNNRFFRLIYKLFTTDGAYVRGVRRVCDPPPACGNANMYLSEYFVQNAIETEGFIRTLEHVGHRIIMQMFCFCRDCIRKWWMIAIVVKCYVDFC